jgi:predicted metal-dependent hydrolase
VQGVAGVPDDLVLGPNDTVLEAQRLLDGGLPFQAHEVLEAAWKHAEPSERDLWQGLAQLAVGQTHALRGNQVGAAALLVRGADRLTNYADLAPYGIDVTGLIAWARAASQQLAEAGTAPPPPRLQR